jgi:hypothetical protein
VVSGLNNNLRPPWKPGQSGNPAGRRKGEASVTEWINAFLSEKEDGTPNYPRARLEEICEDPDASPAKVIAAQRVLGAMKDGRRFATDRRGKVYPAGTDPEPGRDFDRICDRTEGKPVQSVRVERVPDRPSAEILAEIRALLRSDPELARIVAEDRELAADAEAIGLPTAVDTKEDA